MNIRLSIVAFLSPASIFFFIIQIFCWSIAIAQKEPTDSLKKKLLPLRDTARIDCLNELGFQYIKFSKKDSAEHYALLAYEESKKLNYIHGIAESFSCKSRIAKHFDDDFIKSEALGRESLHWYEKTNNKKGIETVYDELWYAFFAESKYDEAYKYAEKKYERCKITGDEYGMYDALSGMGVIHFQKGNYDTSFYFYQQAQQVAFTAKNEIWATSILFNFGTLYRAIEDYATASNYYRQAFQRDNPENTKFRIETDWDIWVKMEYAELFSLQNQFDSAWYYYNLFDKTKAGIKDLRIYLISTGETYFLQKKYNNALQNFLEGLTYHRKLNDRNEVKRTLLDIAKTYFVMNNDKAALKYAQEGLNLALQTKSRQFIRNAYQILYSVYDRLHKTDSAYYYYKKYITIKEVVVSDQTKGRFAAYNYEQKIELLNKEKLINQQQLNLQHQKLKNESFLRNILIGGMFVVLLLSIIVFRNIMLKRKNEKLQSERTQAELKQQSSELEMQALRARMNPHFIFNCLNSINRFILKNETEAASDYLTKFSRLIRMVLINSKNKLITLEDELEMLRLYLDMERFRFKNAFDYNIGFVNSIDINNIFIPPLLLQPFAENAIWHGLMNKEEHGHLEILFRLEENRLICSITDNGIGRKAAENIKSKSAEKQKSMGLRITKERLALLGASQEGDASFEFEDLADKNGNAAGTRVILKITIKDLLKSYL